MITFCRHQLVQFQPRADYKELLELVLIFLDADDGNFAIHEPAVTCHVRFMAKAIYTLKIFIFRDQFYLSANQFKAIRDICIFLIHIYIKVWYGCTNAISAPKQDFDLVINAMKYAQVDSAISNEILRKICSHLWYLSPECMGLAFFDPNITIERKRKMMQRLDVEQSVLIFIDGRKLLEPQELSLYNISDLVSSQTKKFFIRFEISLDFMNDDPSNWPSSDNYTKNSNFCKSLLVVNDAAERGVKFMQDYNRVLTINEQENQFLLQVVEDYRKKYPTYTKSSLMSAG